MRLVECHIPGERYGNLSDREERIWRALSVSVMKTSTELGGESRMSTSDAHDTVRLLCRRKMAKCLVHMHGLGSNARPKMPYYYMKTKLEGETKNDLHVTLRDDSPPAPVLQAK
jgi:hypothetical protein